MRARDASKALADEGKLIALRWIDAAMTALDRAHVGDDDDHSIVNAALAVNFSLNLEEQQQKPEQRAALIARIRKTFTASRTVLERSGRFFIGVSERKARRVFRSPDIPPAYAIYKKAIYFTPRFAPHDPVTGRGFGPLCRAAMVLHESVHVIDPESGAPAIHISEWDEPRFSAQTVEESVHNPSSYASFAAQVHARAVEWPRSARYGAGRAGD